jgi:malate permease and related proteins
MWEIIIASIFWTSLGLCLPRLNSFSSSFPKQLGKLLYWVGVPMQVFGLALAANFASAAWLPPTVTIVVLLLGLALAVICLYFALKFLRRKSLRKKAEQGSFVLSSILGNTGFIGMTVAPALVGQSSLSWILLYGITHNLVGSYGVGVVLANYFGNSNTEDNWWKHCQNIFRVPALWAFVCGCLLHRTPASVFLTPTMKILAIWVIPAVFLLLGMQLSQFRVNNLRKAFLPAAIKMVALPALTGIGLTYLGLHGEARLGLVLMSGMPTAFANAILAEEYELDRQLAAGSILLSTLLLPLSIPLWLFLFGTN